MGYRREKWKTEKEGHLYMTDFCTEFKDLISRQPKEKLPNVVIPFFNSGLRGELQWLTLRASQG